MARTRNATTHAVRRDAILDVAERLIRTRGYDAMSIQSVQDELGCSRGALYHYFGSKEAILEAVIERMTAAGMEIMTPIAEDPDLSHALDHRLEDRLLRPEVVVQRAPGAAELVLDALDAHRVVAARADEPLRDIEDLVAADGVGGGVAGAGHGAVEFSDRLSVGL
jgi:AcrR family transcriptional regulator